MISDVPMVTNKSVNDYPERWWFRFWYKRLNIFAPSSSACISLSVRMPIGLCKSHPWVSHKKSGSILSICSNSSKRTSNWFLMSRATSSTSDCRKTWLHQNQSGLSSTEIVNLCAQKSWDKKQEKRIKTRRPKA